MFTTSFCAQAMKVQFDKDRDSITNRLKQLMDLAQVGYIFVHMSDYM